MNNVNGKELLSRVRPGDLVTVRRPDGSTFTGRYRPNTLGDPLAIHGARFAIVTESNIINVQPRERLGG